MPTSDGETYCFKFVNGHPKNTRRGLLTVAAFGVLADVATGYPRLLADMTLATAFRTAAVSASSGALSRAAGERNHGADWPWGAVGISGLRLSGRARRQSIADHDVDPRPSKSSSATWPAPVFPLSAARARIDNAVIGANMSPRSPRTNKGRQFFPTTWSAPERT